MAVVAHDQVDLVGEGVANLVVASSSPGAGAASQGVGDPANHPGCIPLGHQVAEGDASRVEGEGAQASACSGCSGSCHQGGMGVVALEAEDLENRGTLIIWCISMTMVSPMLMHWRYHSLALSHQCKINHTRNSICSLITICSPSPIYSAVPL